MLKTQTPVTIYLSDYKPVPFTIESVELQFSLFEDRALVETRLQVVPNPRAKDLPSNELRLQGEGMELMKVFLNSKELEKGQYKVDDEGLTIYGVPRHFELEIHNVIFPHKNTALEGLYKSGQVFCTQNEPEGFRKITYFIDRPDVMAKFKTTIIADQKRYPYLLANGNKIAEGQMENARHYVTWEDPFPKPCYLFALVAGDFDVLTDKFVTVSGRKVSLEIYVDKGNVDKTQHAMESLKKSMRWDEKTFGLEYDLDTYMVVAVDSFNMGAMENKGLNIFNSAYVLAKPQTATDQNFLAIEGVIGHEYFHNWTGNRVTCRDWFQLTLKEGLTVFRDQEFSADMNSRAVKRIQDVRRLVEHQFPEDASPLSHPIRPDSYIEINNFYTPTVYEKGAEVIRMIHTLIGKKAFRKGIDKYFELYDGQAVTTEDFIHAMELASGRDFAHFKSWYHTRGTPVLRVSGRFDPQNREYRLHVSQSLPFDQTEVLHIPLKIGLIDRHGKNIELFVNGESKGRETVLEICDKEQFFTFHRVDHDVIPSLNRDFSAPVKIHYPYKREDYINLMKYDENYFNRYQYASTLVTQSLVDLSKDPQKKLDGELLGAFATLLAGADHDPLFLTEVLTLPSDELINSELEVCDFEGVELAKKLFRRQVATKHEAILREIYQTNKISEYKLDPESIGRRSLCLCALDYLSELGREDITGTIEKSFYQASNMTEEIFYLRKMVELGGAYRSKALAAFYDKWNHETLVMQKWIQIQAMYTKENSIKVLRQLEQDPIYDAKVPNLVRSLLASFAVGNLLSFHRQDGSGYSYFADKIIEVDSFNPQMASRLVKIFTRIPNLDEKRVLLISKVMDRILDHKGLSRDTYEVATKNKSFLS